MRCRQWKLDKLILSIVKAKDGYTAIHSQNVSRLAEAIGRELELTDQIITDLKLAALLHDIGKLHISRQILNKPGELDLNERAWIHAHPLIGAKLAKLAGSKAEVVEAILCHHERLDGSGYPNRLGGSELSCISQIIGVADV